MRAGTRRGALVAAVAAAVVLAVGGPALADAITRVRGRLTDKDGKPMVKASIWFEATEIKKRVGPVRTNKNGDYLIATLDVSIAKKWRVVPELPGYKTVKIEYEIVDSQGEGRAKADHLMGSKQEYPELPFALVGDEGRNVVNIVVAKDADFVAAVQAERKRREQGGAAAAAPADQAGAAVPAAAAAPPVAQAPPKIEGGADALKKAKSLADAGRHQEAVEVYKAYVAKDPTGDPGVYVHLGRSLFEVGDDAAAETALKQALTLKPEIKAAHFYLGSVYLRQDRAAEAASELEQEVKVTPDSWSLYHKLGQAYAAAGDKEKAIAAFEQSAQLDPTKPEPLMAMAAIHDERKDTVKRDETYDRVKAVDPKNAAILFYNIGAKARNENRNREAVQAFRKSVEIDPTHAVAYRELAYALMGTGDFPGAIKNFEQYLKLSPQAADAGDIKSTIAALK